MPNVAGAARSAPGLGGAGQRPEHQAIIVVDLGWGDAGKGSMTDYLTGAHGATTVVRYNGGPQAGHNGRAMDGRHHTFSSFGAGMFWPDVETHLAPACLVNPLNMLKEGAALLNKGVSAFSRTTVHGDCVIITPWHRAAGRLRELMRDELAYDRHGSCGEGVGEARFCELDNQATLRARDLTDASRIEAVAVELRTAYQAQFGYLRRSDHPAIQAELAELDGTAVEDVVDVYRHFTELVRIVDHDYLEARLGAGTVIFEGAQGVLLDEAWGFYPHVTWTDTTAAPALTLLAELGYQDRITTLGVLRGYTVRHGAGPMVTEDPRLTEQLPDEHNTTNAWQAGFRVGAFDLPAHRYALEVCGRVDAGVDYLALTCMDRLVNGLGRWRSCTSYRVPTAAGAYFDVQDGYAARIRPPGQRGDLDYLAELTAALGQVEPRYRSWRAGEGADYMDYVGEELSTPIGVVSFGPRSGDKVLRAWRLP